MKKATNPKEGVKGNNAVGGGNGMMIQKGGGARHSINNGMNGAGHC